MAQQTMTARLRQDKGKGVARKLRQNLQIPAVFYGPGTTPIMLTVDFSELDRVFKKSSGDQIIIELQIESDEGSETKMTMIKDLQIDAIKDTYLHADFYEISMDREISLEVPVRLVNIPAGVANGGILQQIRREIAISCLPDKLIDHVEVDVSELEIGDSIHVDDIDLPEGIVTTLEGQLTIAVVAAPTVAEVEEEEEEALLEGEEEAEGEGEETDGEPQAEESE